MSGSHHIGRRTRKIPYKQSHGEGGAGPQSNINVTPLVDVCLVLLIIFMVVPPMMGRGKDVPLPTLVNPDQHKEGDQVFVSVDNDGVWINQNQYTTRGDFQEALLTEYQTADRKAQSSGYNGPLLFLKGDKLTNYGRVRVVMEWIKEKEIQDIALVVEATQE
jgi:biopolymer transport protein ExbD